MPSTDETIVRIRDPLFVISTSLEIIKHQSGTKGITTEIKRIETAIEKINNMIR